MINIKDEKSREDLLLNRLFREDIVDKLAIFGIKGIEKEDLVGVFESFKKDIFGMISVQEFLDLYESSNDGSLKVTNK